MTMNKNTEERLLKIAERWAEEFREYEIFEPLYLALKETYSGRLQPTEYLLKALEEELVDASAAHRLPINCEQFENLVSSKRNPCSPEHVLSTIAAYDAQKPCNVMRSEITSVVEQDIKDFNYDFKIMADYAIGIINNRKNQRFSKATITIAMLALIVNCFLGLANYGKKTQNCISPENTFTTRPK